MKKLIAVISIITVFFSSTLAIHANESHTYNIKQNLDNAFFTNDAVLKGNIINTVIFEKVSYTEFFVQCYFYLNYDDRTGELYTVSLKKAVTEGGESYYSYKTYLGKQVKVDKYTIKVTVITERFLWGGLEDINYQNVTLTMPS